MNDSSDRSNHSGPIVCSFCGTGTNDTMMIVRGQRGAGCCAECALAIVGQCFGRAHQLGEHLKKMMKGSKDIITPGANETTVRDAIQRAIKGDK